MPDTKRTSGGVLGGIAGLVGLSVAAGVLITATVTPAIAVSGAAASSAITLFDNLPSVLQIDDLMLPTELYVNDPATGQPVEWTRFYDQNRSPVTFDQIAPVMYDAILSSEDKNFYQHGGIDIVGTARAIIGGGQQGGGSSISQQYVKNILVQKCERDAPTPEERDQCFTKATVADGTEGYERKLQEMRYAISLEQKYSKNDILLGYLNIANFGGTTYGIDAAARYYFGVPATQLNVAQAATLAGMVQNPNTYRIDRPDGTITDDNDQPLNTAASGYSLTKDRQDYVLDRMLADGKISQQQHDEATAAPIEPHITPPQAGCEATTAPYFCQYVVSVIKNDPAFGADGDARAKALRQGGLKIYTTLDWNVQNAAQQAMNDYVPTSVDGLKFGSTTVSIEAPTGRVLSIAQNSKFSEDEALANDPNYSSLVYAGDATYGSSGGFSAGSTFKLFTLVDWLEKGHSVNETLNGVNRVFKKMTNSCTGDWINTTNTKVGNNANSGGYVGTPMQFTRDSLNSGFFAMAEKLDLCDIQKVATKMGVTIAGTGQPVAMDNQFSIIGSNAVSPMAMAAAYATIANNGIYCQPKVIDKIIDRSGAEIPSPQKTCTQVVEPNIAATAAYALQGVMNGGGTGSQANPDDGTPLIGKTGTHETVQTWMIESNTRVATATWVGLTSFTDDDVLGDYYYRGTALNELRYPIGRDIQAVVDEHYPGGDFPRPDPNLQKQSFTDLPNVVGMSIDDAKRTLENAGFDVNVGGPVDSDQPTNIVAAQDPGAGRVAGGISVTISPSNGQGGTIPGNIVGKSPAEAKAALQAAGYANVTAGPGCEAPTAKVASSNPAPGSAANKSTPVTLTCAAGNGNGGNG